MSLNDPTTAREAAEQLNASDMETWWHAGMARYITTTARPIALPCPVCTDPTSLGEPCDDCWRDRISV